MISGLVAMTDLLQIFSNHLRLIEWTITTGDYFVLFVVNYVNKKTSYI